MTNKHKITRLDLSKPARIIGPNRRSLTGRVTVRGKSVAFESSLERDFLTILDFDPVVSVVYGQPITIKYWIGDREHSYTPDFLVEYNTICPVLYEVKYRQNLWESWGVLKPKFRAARRYAKLNGMQFQIMTEVEIRGAFLSNVNFLRGYRNRQYDFATEEHLIGTLAVLGETTPEALLVASYWTQENRMKAMASVWRLVAIGRIHADLSVPLTMTTPIWVTVGEGYIWQDPHSYRSNLDR
jgi:hypothetical protein